MSLPKSKDAILGHIAEIAKNRNVLAGTATVLLLSLLPRLNAWLTQRKANNYLTDYSWDWEKEIVVVTGGSSGIGKHIVNKLTKRNIKIIILDRNEPDYALAPNIFFYKTDISDPAVLLSVAERIVAEHGDPTVLINNAGIGNAMPILSLPESKIRKIFDVNMIAPILLVKHFLPAMVRRNHGHIVNVGSLASFSTQASNVDYGCTKSGILAFHEGLSQELKHIYKAPLVRTSVIHPTWVKTPLIADLVEKGKLKDTTISPADVANKIVEQLYSGRGAQVVVPSSLGWTSIIRGLPGWIQEGLRDEVSVSLLKASDKM